MSKTAVANTSRISAAAASLTEARDLILQMKRALKMCLECDGKLTWEAEQEARVLLERAAKFKR
jgi:hypothetical protein